MTTRRPRRSGIERLESRAMLSGAAAVLPYVELTLKGHFTAGAPTTVTFAAKHGETITVTPDSLTKTAVVVAVPAFFNLQTGQPIASTASVSVDQTVGDKAKAVRVIKSLSITQLPKTGLMAGDVLGAVTEAAASVTADAQARFVEISEDPTKSPSLRQAASQVVVDLNNISDLIPLAQQELVGLAFGAVNSVPLGTYQGQPATLDVNQLGLLDQIVTGGVDAAIGGTPLTGPGLVASLNGLVTGAILDGPSEIVARAKEVVDVLATATGSPVVPPGVVATGLALGSLSAVVAAAEAEAFLIEETPSPTTNPGPASLALVDQVLDDPALGQALNAITAGLVPTTPAGQALLEAAKLAEGLAAQIDPNVPGSVGAQFAG
jgi:hypothetical protein